MIARPLLGQFHGQAALILLPGEAGTVPEQVHSSKGATGRRPELQRFQLRRCALRDANRGKATGIGHGRDERHSQGEPEPEQDILLVCSGATQGHPSQNSPP